MAINEITYRRVHISKSGELKASSALTPKELPDSWDADAVREYCRALEESGKENVTGWRRMRIVRAEKSDR